MSTDSVLTDAALDAFDPADYPCRVLVTPESAEPDAPVGICWLPTPWADATVQAMLVTLAAGGGLLLIARDPGALVKMRETAELLISTAGES